MTESVYSFNVFSFLFLPSELLILTNLYMFILRHSLTVL
ncbi:putative membrane protein [Synechococcus sp. A15-127]|nr:putative membrane protein [Synechococcus sp. A15-127]